MAAQNHIAISDPSLSPMSAELIRAVDKGQKKQKQELAKLKTVLRLVEKEVAETKSSASAKPSDSAAAESPSNTKFEQSMASMVLALQMLQVLIGKYGNDKAKQHKTISTAELDLAKATLKDVEKQIKKMAKEAKAKKVTSEVEKWAEVALGVVTILVGAALAQPELVVMGVLSLAAAAGAFKEATKYTAMALEAMGVSKKVAEPLAAGIVCAVVIVASIAAADPEAAVEETAEAGTEVGADVAEDAADASLDATEDTSSNVGSKIKEGFKSAMKALGPRGRIGLMSLFTALSGTQVVQKSYNSIALDAGVSEKKRKKIEQDIGYAIMALSFAFTLSMGIGAASVGGATSDAIAVSVKTANRLRVGLKAATAVGVLGTASAQGVQGVITIEQGKLQEELMDDQATMTLLGTLMQMNSSETSEDQRSQASAEKSQKLDDKSATQLMKGIEGFANIAAYSSPV